MNLLTTEPCQNRYSSPLADRYASAEMLSVFSPQKKYSTWRALWIALAEAEQELGLPITDEQLGEMRRFKDELNLDAALAYEEELQHDVMAHIHAYGDQSPSAKPIIHLGATSCFVTDNTDLIQMREGMKILRDKLAAAISQLADFAKTHAGLTTLAYTHFQAAQPTTVGKRTCLWIQDFIFDLEELDNRIKHIPFLGAKGTTGTQASFLTLFNGDLNKVNELDKKIAAKLGFAHLFAISGQTYSRKLDTAIVHTLGGIASSAHKFATDLRLLAHLKEVEEPFKEKQIGSSAMPYKRNPMLSERICSLSRFLISLGENPAYTHATQWFERTLDDSANRRLVLPEAFLTCDAILNLLLKVTSGLVVYPKMIAHHLEEELPFMIMESILMHSVQKGGDRQSLHEKIRVHSRAAADEVKHHGRKNDLLDRIAQDPSFRLNKEELQKIMTTEEISGCSKQQVALFLKSIERSLAS